MAKSLMTYLFIYSQPICLHHCSDDPRRVGLPVNMVYDYVNFLLVFVPLGLIAGALEWGSTAVFTLNFFAIIPLASILSFATEEISVRLGETLGGLLNATFGNAVELIVSIIALQNDQIEVVKSSMLGSILSNLLLVMGMCFFLGGVCNNMRDGSGSGSEQQFASGTAQTACSLMALSAASMVIPATLAMVIEKGKNPDAATESILILSRGTAIILLLLYVLYLYFQLRTHKNLFNPEAPQGSDAQEGEEPEEASISAWSAAAVLIGVTVVISFCADYLVDSIDDIVATGKISKNFIGLILIPIVGNAAEHVTACVVAIRDKMDLAMGVAVGSSIQIALLVTPFLVLLGWAMGKEMDFQFETFETVAFFISVLVVTYVVQDGRSNYLEGAMLFGLYIIIALAFYATPSDALDRDVANPLLSLLRLR
ncbi:cation transporter activity protein [Cryphonectria parasitica EP155]|uniref:Vacuolar calcium ion transporter n=1 Tax=Cryphonectria parasitica (strain ATCC 38755 / EP155) TaxID=660469 RepID=A0A9P4XU67_CRYP1|nr:cation transporter activity protein [Cryphonectria parasitica EP155]KAF3761364.1 cation transporter activity protein [Cryphonectria parasitica EP155]